MPPTRQRSQRTNHPRRTQAERRAVTRGRLLNATVDRLTRDGYAGMSTNDIVRKAGVSRGALVHHFPTKARLAVAALDRWLDDRLADFEAEFAELTDAERTPTNAIDVLWRMFQGATFAAWLELTVAARTDKELRSQLALVHQRFNDGVLDAFSRAFPAAADDPAFDPAIAVRFAFTVLTGAAVNRVIDGPSDEEPESITTLKFLATTLVTDPWSTNS